MLKSLANMYAKNVSFLNGFPSMFKASKIRVVSGVPSENSVINYMPSLQWLLVNINNNHNNNNNISIKTA